MEDNMRFIVVFPVSLALLTGTMASAQQMPADYQQVLTTLGKQGDFKDQVLKVNIPRNDVQVTVAGVATPTPFGFGGWIAMTKASDGNQVMMGDLVLLQDEVNPVMSALLNAGLDVTALHNHFFLDEPRMFYMHVHGHGSTADLTKRIKPALDLIGASTKGAQAPASNPAGPPLDTAKLAQIVGHMGEQSGSVYKITIGRDDLKVLRKNGLQVVAIHHHMTNERPMIIFLHYWGTGPAETLAAGFKAAVDELGKHSTGKATQD